ncbi:hypothetical protein RND71_024330 [Anisodus tanguticus]|uniref:Uncharacterized protein n=1 Tax=Anisodus tanguticus TaxID=243964 RepID=A0AAE1VBJ7_9SOLA|nr:hypothetical protein RND71_024330 [Anisodus tanguticus]
MCFIALIILLANFAPSFEARKLLNNMKNKVTDPDHSQESNLLLNAGVSLHFSPRNNEVQAKFVSRNQFAHGAHIDRNLASVPSPGIRH